MQAFGTSDAMRTDDGAREPGMMQQCIMCIVLDAQCGWRIAVCLAEPLPVCGAFSVDSPSLL